MGYTSLFYNITTIVQRKDGSKYNALVREKQEKKRKEKKETAIKNMPE